MCRGVRVVEAELVEPALLLLVVERLAAALDLAAQAAHRRGGDHALGRAADPHHRVHAGAAHRGGDAGREVAVGDQADARAGLADVGDELLVRARGRGPRPSGRSTSRSKARGDVAQVLGHRRVEVDHAARGRADDDLVHVDVGRVEQAAALGGGEHRDRVRGAGGAEVGALERIDRDVDLGRAVVPRAPSSSPT